MQNLQFSWMTLGLATSLLFGVTACQPQAATPPESNEVKTAQQPNQKAITAPKPATVSKPSVTAKTCLALSKSMQKIDDTSKIEDIYNIQQTLKTCLPTANNAEVLTLLDSYQAMYNRFLGIDIYMDDESFGAIAEALEQGKKVPVQPLEATSPRIQYLVKLVESKADVSVLYLGEGNYTFHHSLQAMADIFTPFIQPDQKYFIDKLAKDNQDIFWNDGRIAVPFEELINRAVFWESYTNQYQNSHFIQDAKALLIMYRRVLFSGLENTQWTDDDIRKFYDPADDQAILQLAKRPNSVLAQDAQTLLKFMAISDDERQQLYPVPKSDEEGHEIQDWKKGRYQLEQASSIPSPWQENNGKDCFSSIICVDYNAE